MRIRGKMQCADGEEDPGALPDGVEGDGWVGREMGRESLVRVGVDLTW